MFAKINGAGILGLDGFLLTVEVDIANGIPGLEIVGLPDAAVRESKERVRAAIRNAGFEFPCRRITVNLAPADLKKDGSGLDLPIAIGILSATGQLDNRDLSRIAFAGELSLDAQVRSVSGVLPMAVMCRQQGLDQFIVPAGNATEARVVDQLKIIAVDSLAMAVEVVKGESQGVNTATVSETCLPIRTNRDDFRDVQGQFAAKRAIEIAVAGSHNVLMTGPPGAGKTMLARRIPSIFPAMTKDEALEVSKIYSVAGLPELTGGLVQHRPFRAPHHTVSAAAMAGGGRIPRPGEVTLAHNGVLFLDELPEFPRQVLEVLRQPIEDGKVCVSRVTSSYTFPSKFMLVASMNPCPCGFLGDPFHECSCSDSEIKRYVRRISGPLMDRIDINIIVPQIEYSDMVSAKEAESSASIAMRVESARQRQSERLVNTGIHCNSQMNHRQLREQCRISTDAQILLRNAFERLKLNARSYDRIIKVSQTIADLSESKEITDIHMAEAIQLRVAATVEEGNNRK